MNKVTVKGVEYKLKGEMNLRAGQVLNFKAKDRNNVDFRLADVKGKKVVSVFPALNTRVCDAQTLQITQWSQEYKDVEFVSITNDTIETITQWCAAHGISNVRIVSDRDYHDFANTTNLYVEGWDKLSRGFIILDEENKVMAFSFKTEESEDPDYELVKKYL